MHRTLLIFAAVLGANAPVAALAGAAPAMAATTGPANATVLIVRHAEKPIGGAGLTPMGEARARAYVGYFTRLRLGRRKVRIDELVAAADTPNSVRPRLTLTPLSNALHLNIDQPIESYNVVGMADWLQHHAANRTVLIAWHHSAIPSLIEALGGTPAKLLPAGRWPDPVFDRMVVLKYDEHGQLLPDQVRIIQEDLAITAP